MTITQLPLRLELELIHEAKNGNNEAAQTLLDQYQPVIRSSIRKHEPYLDRHELESASQAGFIEAIHKFNPAKHARLSTVIKYELVNELRWEENTYKVVQVPDRTAQRYHQIMKKSEGDVNRLLKDWDGQHNMSKETFLNIHSINTASGFFDHEQLDAFQVTSTNSHSDEVPEAVKENLKSVFELRGDDNDLTPEEVQVLAVQYGLAGVDDDKSFDESSFELDMTSKAFKEIHDQAILKARSRLSNSNQ